MSAFNIYGLGIITGLLVAFVLAVIVKYRVAREMTAEWSRRSGLRRDAGESLEAFMKRASPMAAERELEQKWGIPRADGETWDAYTSRVAEHRTRTSLRMDQWTIGPRGQA